MMIPHLEQTPPLTEFSFPEMSAIVPAPERINLVPHCGQNCCPGADCAPHLWQYIMFSFELKHPYH